jgi:hypothetical protein
VQTLPDKTAQINDLFHGSVSSDKFRSMCRCLAAACLLKNQSACVLFIAVHSEESLTERIHTLPTARLNICPNKLQRHAFNSWSSSMTFNTEFDGDKDFVVEQKTSTLTAGIL